MIPTLASGHTSIEYPMIRTPIKWNIVHICMGISAYTHNELIHMYKKTYLLSVTQL